jgi:hypothetical protein
MANNFSNVMMNPMFTSGLSLLAGGLQGSQAPAQDLMLGMGLASSMQQAKRQRQMYELQVAEQEAKKRALEQQQQNLANLITPGMTPQQEAAIRLAPEAYAKSLLPSSAEPSAFAEKLQMAGIDTNTPEGQQFVRDILKKPVAPTINIGQMNKPLSANDLTKFWDPKTGEGPVPGDTMQDIVTKGLKPKPEFAEKGEARKRIFTDLNKAIDEYITLIDKYGVEVVTGDPKGQIMGAKNRLTMGLKEYDDLGAPQAGDLMLLAEAIPDMAPTTTIGKIGAKLTEPWQIDQAKGQLNQLKRQLAMSENTIRESLKQPLIEIPPPGDGDEGAQQQGGYQVPDDVYQRMKELGVVP